MTSKNRLQEYFQKKDLDLPIYSTARAGGEDHNPTWISQVSLCDGRIFVSDPHSKKKYAELESATDALAALEIHNIESDTMKYCINFNDSNVVICIDVENQPCAIAEFVKNVSSTNVTVYGFISDGHPLQKKLEISYYLRDERVNLIKIPSTRADGADIGMSMIVGSFIETMNYGLYMIISNDHFGEALADCIRGYQSILPSANRSRKLKSLSVRSIEDALCELCRLCLLEES